MATPRIANAAPSRRLPDMSHSVHTVSPSTAMQATIASRSWALIAASSRSTTTAGPWSARSMTASPHSATLNCNRYRSMERTIGQRQAEASLRLQRPPSPSPPQPGDDPGRRPAAIPGGRLRRHHDRRDRRRGGRVGGADLQGLRRQAGAGPRHLRPRPDRPRTGPGLPARRCRSEEHTSELQSRRDLVCRLLLEKKKTKQKQKPHYHKKKNKK